MASFAIQHTNRLNFKLKSPTQATVASKLEISLIPTDTPFPFLASISKQDRFS